MTQYTRQFEKGSFYRLVHPQEGSFVATFDRMEKEHDGEVHLAVFYAHMDGEEVVIDMDFVAEMTSTPIPMWVITNFVYGKS